MADAPVWLGADAGHQEFIDFVALCRGIDLDTFDDKSTWPLMKMRKEHNEQNLIIGRDSTGQLLTCRQRVLGYLVNSAEKMALQEDYRVYEKGTEKEKVVWSHAQDGDDPDHVLPWTLRETHKRDETPQTALKRGHAEEFREFGFVPNDCEIGVPDMLTRPLPNIHPSTVYHNTLSIIIVTFWFTIRTIRFSCNEPVVLEDDGVDIHLKPVPYSDN